MHGQNRIIFNADTYLKNLTEDEAKNMLVSSKTLPFVKFLETEQAESIYNKLFVEEGNLDSIVKDIISDELDESITIDNDSLTDTEKIKIYNKILKNLNLTKKVSKEKISEGVVVADDDEVVEIDGEQYKITYQPNITADEIDTYGELLGFTRNHIDNTLTIPSLSDFRSNLLNKKTEINAFLSNYASGEIPLPSPVNNHQNVILNNETVSTMDLENLSNDLKYRVRNNREAIANSLVNILTFSILPSADAAIKFSFVLTILFSLLIIV